MATTISFVNYVCEQLQGIGDIRYRKMFGEYMVYVNDKPVVIVCDNTTYVKKLEIIKDLMSDASCGFPYKGASEHYILNVDDADFCKMVVGKIEKVAKLPKKRKNN